MVKSRYSIAAVFFVCLYMTGCVSDNKKVAGDFDSLKETVNVNNWQFALYVENQNQQKAADTTGLTDQYLKATLHLSNAKTKKSLLYSISDNIEDYETKYKFLSFGCKDDLYIKYKEEFIYPIGYVFEPSSGLAETERLVYKFQIDNETYRKLKQDNNAVEYWYIDRLIGLGKICFTHNN